MNRRIGLLSGLLTILALTIITNQKVNAYPLNPQAPIIFGGDLHMVESADFNQDGNNDLVITDGKTFRGIGVLYGNGNGTFASPLIIGDSDTYEYGLKIADLNNDTWDDIVVVNGAQSQLQIYINDTTGAFLPEYYVALPDVGFSHGNLDIADVNTDGYLDIAVPSNLNAFHLLINDTTANFPTVTSFAGSNNNSHEELAFGDLNNDGHLDIAVTDPFSNLIDIFYGDSVGNFALSHNFSAIAPYGIRVKDIDNDGIKDVVFTQNLANEDVLITDELGNTKFSIPAGYGFYVRAEDINLDGNVDIIFSDQSVPGIKVALGNGGGFDPPVDYLVNNSPLGIAINDFDGDSLPDVAAVNHGDTLSIFLTSAPPTQPAITIIGSPVTAEGGANGQFQVVLDSNPSDTVFVTFSSTTGQANLPVSDTICFVPTGASVNPGSPYDPCSTWNVGQTVYVGAIDDLDVEGTHSDALSLNITSVDTNYNALSVPPVDVTVYDNEIPAVPSIKVTTSNTSNEVLVDEQGSTSDTYQISLVGIPSANVTIDCSIDDGTQTIITPVLASYTVTPLNANIDRNFLVQAIDDLDIEGDHKVIITCVTSSSDPAYNKLEQEIIVRIADNDVIVIDTDLDGDPDITDPDDDGDNVPDAVEDDVVASDGNSDGIKDSLQANVTSSPNTVTGTYMTFVVAGDCRNTINYNTNPEANHLTQDNLRDYPIGFNSFKIVCDSPGAVASISWILDKAYDTSSWQYQKYYPGTGTYVTLPGVSYSTVTISGQTKTAVNYSVIDGSEYDIDGQANAEISDPNGPGLVVSVVADPSNLSNTGRNILVALISIFIAIAGLYVTIRKPRKSYKNIKRRSFHSLITNKFSKK